MPVSPFPLFDNCDRPCRPLGSTLYERLKQLIDREVELLSEKQCIMLPNKMEYKPAETKNVYINQ